MTTDVNRLTSSATPPPAGAVPMVPSLGARAMLEALERLGHDGDELRAAAGLSHAALGDPDGLVPCTAYEALIEGAYREHPRRNLALRMVENTPIGAYPLIDYLVLTSPTLGEGLRRLSRYYRLVGAPMPLELHEDEHPIRVVPLCPMPFFAEYSVALGLLDMARETNGGVRAEWASFMHEPEDISEYEAAFGCEVRVRQSWTGYALSRETWHYAMPRRDPALLGLLEPQAEKALSSLAGAEMLSPRVRRAQAAGLANGDASMAGVARVLAMSKRTLQRRLASEGTSFQQLFDEVRRETAERHLRGAVFSIAEIAFVLGYSEPAAFHRAFRRWNGTTPQAFRAGRERAG